MFVRVSLCTFQDFGICGRMLTCYERGYQTIPVEHLLVLADYYHVSVDYLLGRTNRMR